MVKGLKAALAVCLALAGAGLVVYFWFPNFILNYTKQIVR